MITTVTTTTTTTLSGAASLALVAIATLLILMVKKEIFLASQKEWAARLGAALNVGIIPLLMVFVANVVMRMASILR